MSVTRSRHEIWVGGEDDRPGQHVRPDVHGEDDMVAIETTDLAGNEVTIYLCQPVQARVAAVISALAARQ